MPRLIYSRSGRVRVAHGATGRPLTGQPRQGFPTARAAESWYFSEGPGARIVRAGNDDNAWHELSARHWRETRRRRERYLRARFPDLFPAD